VFLFGETKKIYLYLQMNTVMRIVKDNDLSIQEQVFDNSCAVTVEIRKGVLNQVLGKLDKISGGDPYLFAFQLRRRYLLVSPS